MFAQPIWNFHLHSPSSLSCVVVEISTTCQEIHWPSHTCLSRSYEVIEHCFSLTHSWPNNLDFVQCPPWSQISFWNCLKSYSIYPCMWDRSSHALNMIVANIFLHLVVDVWNLCQLSTFSIIYLCFTLLACTRARIFACSQFTYRGFLTCTSIVKSKFWLTTCFLGFFCSSINRSSMGYNCGWIIKKTFQ